jgi:tetratricopeptide (TPR) repeat protein
MATAAVLDAVKNQPPVRARKRSRKISKDLDYVLAKGLRKDPRDRYGTIKSFMQDLERVLEGRPVRSPWFKPLYFVRNSVRQHTSLYVAMLLICMSLGVGYFYYDKNMTEIRTEQAIGQARIVGKELEIASVTQKTRKRADSSRARVNMGYADKYVIAEDWSTARDMYEEAASLSRVSRDFRTAAFASLEQARCETMMGNSEAAIELYKGILDNSDASPELASMAHFDCLVILITQKRHREAHEVYEENQKLTIAPFSDFTSCLVNELSREDVKRRIEGFADAVKNDALLTMAVRSWLDNDVRGAKMYFRECPKASKPHSEWPAPYAKYLYGKLF